MRDLLADARRALTLERRAGLQPEEIQVIEASAEAQAEDQGIWKLRILSPEPLETHGSWVGAAIDRQLVDTSPEERTPPWRAEILEVDADADALYVAANAPWPGPGSCRIWPFDFLQAPHRVLHDGAFASLHERLQETLELAVGDRAPSPVPTPGPPELAAAWHHRWSCVWGPPGTGKTHTLVEQVAILLADPTERILVLSTTHKATDEVALRLGQRLRSEGRDLSSLWRIGRVAHPQAFRDQQLEVLLPQETGLLLQEIGRLRERIGRARHRSERAALAQEILGLERQLPTLASRALDRDARCLLATLHAGQRALVDEEVRRALVGGQAPFTTVILDEAGLVPRVLAATVGLLASRRVVLVGDPRQLSPIARASRSMAPRVLTWVARSALDHLTEPTDTPWPHVQRLNVQHRMHPDIRAAVSALAYDHALRDAPELSRRPWEAGGSLRQLPRAAWYVLDAHHLHRPAGVSSQPGPTGHSRVRPLTIEIIEALLDHHPALARLSSVLLVTPFRAQRDLLRRWLGERGLRGWSASTVHAQQGSEADVVLFDTVHASSTSWPAEEWVRLVNVGLSRARQWVLLLASRAELSQPFLRAVRPHLPPRVLLLDGHQRRWTTLDEHGRLPKDTTDLFAPQPAPLVAAPEPPQAHVEPPLPSGATLGDQLRRRQQLRPVLSHEQARLVHRDLSDTGPRLVRGVAGSGKTLVLAHWAVRAIRGLGVPRVTIVYANRALRPLLERLFDEAWQEATGGEIAVPWSRVHLVHVGELLHGLLRELDEPVPDPEERGARYDYEGQARRLLQRVELAPRFDAAFLDEAQDLGHETLRLLIQLVRPNGQGLRPVLIFFDNAQNVYGRGTPRWSDLGLDLRGRSDVMRESFRSTRPATEWALGALDRLRPLQEDPDLRELMRSPKADGLPLLEAEGDGESRRWRARFCSIDGQQPAVRSFPTREEEVAFVVRHVSRWIHREDVAPQDICVLTNNQALRTQLCQALSAQVPVEHRTYQGFVGVEGVTVSTAHSFKGYDAELVVVAGADTFATSREPLPAPLYVAMTRARTGLLVTGTCQPPGSPSGRVLNAVIAAHRALWPGSERWKPSGKGDTPPSP